MSMCRQLDEKITDLATRLGEAALKTGCWVATAESCTGGGVAEAITRISGSSGWFDRAFVTYTNVAKQEMLGVKAETLDGFGAVSEQTAMEMAKGALRHSNAKLSVAISGVAGPTGGTDDKPVGTVWFAWAQSGQAHARCLHFEGDRLLVRQQSVVAALEGLLGRLQKASETTLDLPSF